MNQEVEFSLFIIKHGYNADDFVNNERTLSVFAPKVLILRIVIANDCGNEAIIGEVMKRIDQYASKN